jgi:RNA polymerase sigma-70 factor (ECF subfamily)
MSEPRNDLKGLIADAKAGSRKALGDLLHRNEGPLRKKAGWYIGAELSVKIGDLDVVQEALMTAVQKFPEFHGCSQQEIASWLTRILRRKIVNLRKEFHCGKRDVAKETPLTPSMEAELQAKDQDASEKNQEQAELMSQAFWALPMDYQEVIRLRHREKMPFAEVAAVMQRSVGAVKKLWTRALRLWSKKAEFLKKNQNLEEDRGRPRYFPEEKP